MSSLDAALAEAERIPNLKFTSHIKLEAQVKLGTTLAIHKGPQTNEAASALEKARTLAEEADARTAIVSATWGLYLNTTRNQRLDRAKVIGEELLGDQRKNR